jgi:hypothetical protein
MTREEYIKVCKLCENRKQDYEHGMICSLTNKIADFKDNCPSFVSDNEAVLNSIKKNTETEKITQELLESHVSQSPWRAVLAIIVAILAVIRLIVAFSR